MIVLAFAFVAGLLTILAPCTLPVVPARPRRRGGGGRRRIGGIFARLRATSFVAITVVFAAALAAIGFTTGRLRILAASSSGWSG